MWVQMEHNGRRRSRGMLPSSQHFGGVEGHVGASGWDQEELTSFTHSHRPAHNPHKMVSAQLEHPWCQDEPRATRTHKIHHSPDLGEATTFPLIVYSVAGHGVYIQMAFLSRDSQVGVPKSCQLGLPRLWSPISFRSDLRLRRGLRKSYSSRRELSNDMWHAPCS